MRAVQSRAGSLRNARTGSLEGSVIEMKPATLVPQDTAVSLKAKSGHNLRMKRFYGNRLFIFLVVSS